MLSLLGGIIGLAGFVPAVLFLFFRHVFAGGVALAGDGQGQADAGDDEEGRVIADPGGGDPQIGTTRVSR